MRHEELHRGQNGDSPSKILFSKGVDAVVLPVPCSQLRDPTPRRAGSRNGLLSQNSEPSSDL